MKEIGGYIELDTYHGKMLHEDAKALNCGRHCLTYLIRSRKIERMLLPCFICDSVINVCRKEGIRIRFYSVNDQLHPIIQSSQQKEWVYVVNYYGQISSCEIKELKKMYKNLILDNTHAYFQSPTEGVDTIYSCRKYFGVPDGAFLYSSSRLEENLKESISYSYMNFLLGRYEKTAKEFYEQYRENNDRFDNEPLMAMSKLTKNLLRAVDYIEVKIKRTKNFKYLHERFWEINYLKLIPYDGAFMYPLYIRNGRNIRNALSEQGIYIPVLWPEVYTRCGEGSLEYDMAQNILPLPIDQRYGYKEMEKMYNMISCLL